MSHRTLVVAAAVALSVLAVPRPSYAVDGVIEINQARALAGGVTGSLTDDPAGFPVMITKTGSYRLTGNLTLTAAQNAINITVPNVTLDLNGFVITGPGKNAANSTGIQAGGGVGTKILNGTIRDFGDGGLFLGRDSRVESVAVESCDSFAIYAGQGSIITRCTAALNTNGLHGDAGSTFEDCTARQNDNTGIDVSAGSTVSGCVAFQNQGAGFVAGEGSTLTRNTAMFNVVAGFTLSEGCNASNNVSHRNTGPGFIVKNGLDGGSVLIGNTITDNNDHGVKYVGTASPEALSAIGFAHNAISANSPAAFNVTFPSSSFIGGNVIANNP